MPEPINVAIASALWDWFVAGSILPAAQRAAPLVNFTPVVGTPYIEAHPILRAAPEHFNLDFDGSDILRGVYQLDAVVPDGQGEAPGLRLASLIVDRFPIGTTLVANARNLRVSDTPTIAAALRDAAWVRYPVSIPYILVT